MGQPLPYDQLQLRMVVNLSSDLAITPNSIFNSRYFDGQIYVNQINVNAFGRYPSGSPEPDLLVNNSGILEHRMVAPFRGALSKTYLLGSGSGAALNFTFSRYDYYGTNRVDAPLPDAFTAEGFDWVDDNTVIYTVYTSGNRRRVCLVDLVAEPFSITRNTTWNASGNILSAATTRIRNVRVGDVYKGYAYYGDAGQNTNPGFYALNLATGVETLLGNAGTLTGSGSFGVWTVVERAGYLYVQTTDNGVQVYQMNSATSLGPLFTTYAKEWIDAITGNTQPQFWSFDVTPDGKMILGTTGNLYEIGPPKLNVTSLGTELNLWWPVNVTGVLIQSAPNLAPGSFSDMATQPTPWVDGKYNKASVPITPDATFFRLRRFP